MSSKSLSTAKRLVRRYLWRVTATTLLAALTAASLGIAIPVVVNKISDELYPCMHCSCSCSSADACWLNCCCFTQQQKLDWAKANGVVPPAFVVVAAREEAALPPCCRKRLAKACCNKQRICCASDGNSKQVVPAGKGRHESSERVGRRIALLDELRCQGMSMQLTSLPPGVMPPLPCVTETPSRDPEVIAISNGIESGQLPPPDLPPPELAV